jgi:hypothetical protein
MFSEMLSKVYGLLARASSEMEKRKKERKKCMVLKTNNQFLGLLSCVINIQSITFFYL